MDPNALSIPLWIMAVVSVLQALLLIGIGIVSILLGIMEYWQRAKDLSVHEDIPIWRATFVVAVAIALLSVSLLVAVSFKAL